MKITLNSRRRPEGFILLLVMVLTALSVVIMSGVMNRTSTVALLNMRSNQLDVLDNAAEAACEKVYARMAWDFESYGPGQVTNNLTAVPYHSLVPNGTDNSYWTNFVFSDPTTGSNGSVYVGYAGNYNGPLPSQFTNQFAYNSPIYRLACDVQWSSSLANVVGTAQEDVLLALVPITTYAIFYNGELEFSDCATMTVNGRVHSNADVCVGAGSGSTLTFNAPVTAVTTVSAPERGNVNDWTATDPTTWSTTFNSGYTTNNPVVNIAISMTNTHSIIDIPPPPMVESPESEQGLVRLYNQAQVVLVVSNTAANTPVVLLTLQAPYNGDLPAEDTSKDVYDLTNATPIALQTNANNATQIALPFLTITNDSFADQRQNSGVQQFVTQVDVSQYNSWLLTNPIVTGKFPSSSPPTILYVADRRNIGTTKQAVVRLVSGAKLPYNGGLGFTVATQNPLYVENNYNVTVDSNSYAYGLGSTTNGETVPAALLSDAITILSPSWNDAYSASAYSLRPAATSMTLNAALVTGNMPSTGTSASTFSGGVQNLTRLLENWGGTTGGTNTTLTLNTSIVCLFSSEMATNQFQMPGTYYSPPVRNWGFDTTYYSPNKQPPGVPCALLPIRFNWYKPPPGGLVTGND